MAIIQRIVVVMFCIVAVCSKMQAQSTSSYNLEQLLDQKKLTIVNREANYDTKGSMEGIALSEDVDEGLAWINGVSFSTGTIEVDLKGQDVFQHSFVGIAFHGMNDSTFEAIYFRPFQFKSTDATLKARGIQYINLPANTWRQLRADHPGVYENVVEPSPDPDDWFHVKIIVTETKITVYANNADDPCLQINSLSKLKTGKIGLYTADRSGGSFANLVIKND